MHKHTKIQLGIAVVVCLGAIFSLFAPTLRAIDTESGYVANDTGCGPTNLPYYTSITNLPQGVYDIYVKLGKIGQLARVESYTYPGEDVAQCVPVGAVDASGNEWRKLGIYTSSNASTQQLFQLSSSILKDVPDANRPTLMFISKDNPVCVPTVECQALIQGQAAFLRPNGLLLNDNSLNILRVVDPASDTVTKVEYYADNELLYQTKSLEDFNIDLVPFYAHTLYRVMYFASGQKAILQSTVPTAHADSLQSFLVRTYRQYQQTVYIIGGIVLTASVLYGIQLTLYAIGKYRLWRIAHGFEQTKPETPLTPERERKIALHRTLKKIARTFEVIAIIIGASAIIVLAVSTYCIQIGTVNGHSMETSFHTDDKIVINKLPVTFARINNREYIPARGEVIIAHPNFGTDLKADQNGDEDTIIKRVIGLPGEHIVIDHGAITIYNSEHKDGFDPSTGTTWAANVQQDDSEDHIDITLGTNELFLCGDNRPVSIDSRYNGPINASQVVGVVVYTY